MDVQRNVSLIGAVSTLFLVSAGPVSRSVTGAPTGRESLSEKAALMCERAQAFPVASKLAIGPALGLIKAADSGEWTYQDAIQHPPGPVEASAVRALICIKETLRSQGKYDDGALAFDRLWHVRVLGWPEGELLRERVLVTSAPSSKMGSGPGVGNAPVDDLATVLDDPAILHQFSTPPAGPFPVALSPDGKSVGAVDRRTFRVFDAATGKVTTTIQVEKRSLGIPAFSPDGRRLALAATMIWDSSVTAQPSAVSLWDLTTADETSDPVPLSPAFTPGTALRVLMYSPDGRHIAAYSSEGNNAVLRLLDASSGKIKLVLEGGQERVFAFDAAFSRDGRRLAATAGDSVRVWSVETGAILETRALGHMAASVALSADGRLLAVGHRLKLSVWEGASGTLLWDLPHPRDVESVAFSPDDRLLATATEEPAVRVFDVASGEQIKRFGGFASHIEQLLFSDDSTRLHALAKDGVLKTWGVRSSDSGTKAVTQPSQ